MPALLLKKPDVLFLRTSSCSLLTLELVYRVGWLKRSRRRQWLPESYFSLSSNEQQEALQYASAQSGRPIHLLEKDLWVVWTLKTLFESQAGADLTFKGGTSLSKAYKIIDRLSEDIDLTCNIRKLTPDRTSEHGELPSNRSQAKKWVKDINVALEEWIIHEIQPILERAIQHERIHA